MAKNENTNPKKDFKDKFFVKPVRHYRKYNNLSNMSDRGSDFFLKGGKGNENLIQKNGEECITEKASSSQTTDGTASNSTKKPFDKKKYRLKKYSNRYKLQQWENKRKKAVLHEYHREIKHHQPTRDIMKIYEEDQNPKSENDTDCKLQMSKVVSKPHEGTLKAEKLTRKEELLKQKTEREKAKLEARKAKLERSKKLARKTKKGQPIMKYRIQMLLDKILEDRKE